MRSIILFLLICISSVIYADATLYPVNGKPVAFSTLQGKWVFINYWASWCDPCLDEIPELNKFYKENQDKIALFAVNYDMVPLSMQKRLMSDHQIHYPALAKDPANALVLGEIRGIPATFVFNPKGELVTTLYGGQKAKDLNRLMM